MQQYQSADYHKLKSFLILNGQATLYSFPQSTIVLIEYVTHNWVYSLLKEARKRSSETVSFQAFLMVERVKQTQFR